MSSSKKDVQIVGIIMLILIAAIFGVIISSNKNKDMSSVNGSNQSQEDVSLVDVEQYGNITGNELIALVGEPDNISQSSCQGAFEIPCVYYEYDNANILGEVNFVLVNDQVVRFTSYNEYPYESKDAILAQFGITKETSCAVAVDTNDALRYRCPSAKVDDFWISLIEGNTFGFLQVTYDMEYYEEWYLPITASEEVKYKTDAELTMKSLLTYPKTADFPWYDWEYGKNLFYILISSYVDAKNAFGVEMRNTFTFVYSRHTEEIVLAIVNDEVVVNNGYVATDELIEQLYGEINKEKEPSNDEALAANVSTDYANDTNAGNADVESLSEYNSGNTSEEFDYDNSIFDYGNSNDDDLGVLPGGFLSNWEDYAEETDNDVVAEDRDLDGMVEYLPDGMLPGGFLSNGEDYTEETDNDVVAEDRNLDGVVEYLSDIPEWISEDDLSQYGLSAFWAGEEIWIWESMNSDNNYTIYGSPKSTFESGIEYSGTYNGHTIRFRANGGIEFFCLDLVNAGIIRTQFYS